LKEGLELALSYPVFDAILKRRSRRFGVGMAIEDSVMQFKSKIKPIPLTEEEEALITWAGVGLTGVNLGDIPPEKGLSTIIQWTGRTFPSACNAHATELFYTNDDGLYIMKLRDAKIDKVSIFEGLSKNEVVATIIDLFKKYRVKLKDGRAELPDSPPGLFEFNAWNANKPGTTLFFPITDLTIWYIDLLMLYCSRSYAITIVDEMHGVTAGVDEYVKKGRLNPNLKMSLYEFEKRVVTGMVVEQAIICHNINLASQAIGLGGWTFTGFLPFYALGGTPEYPGLGFRFVKPKNGTPIPVGRDGVFEAYCPPYYKDMDEAVEAWIKDKERYWSEAEFPYKDKKMVENVRFYSDTTVQIVKDICNYIYNTYGRFPAFIEPMFSRLQAQAHHLDPEFYDTHFKNGTYSDIHKRHFEIWHPDLEI